MIEVREQVQVVFRLVLFVVRTDLMVRIKIKIHRFEMVLVLVELIEVREVLAEKDIRVVVVLVEKTEVVE